MNLKKKKERQICKPGDVLAVPLKNGKKFMYLRCLEDSEEFYDLITNKIISDVQVLKNHNVIFDVPVYKQVLNSMRWPKIGKIPFENEEEMWGRPKFGFNPIKNHYQYHHKGVDYGKLDWGDAKHLDVNAVWDFESIEERLNCFVKSKKDIPREWDKHFVIKPNDPALKIMNEAICDS